MSIPSGEQVIKCNAYADRVADLSKEDLNGPIIGFRFHNGFNQRWTFNKKGPSGIVYEISTIAKGGGVSFAHIRVPRSDEVLTGSPNPLPWVLEAVGGKSFRIFITDPNTGGLRLYWTLRTDIEETKIILEPFNGDASQIWSISPA